jgi:hypothetical protein
MKNRPHFSSSGHRFAAFLLLCLVGALPSARALDVFNYNATTNERFGSDFPSTPMENSSFFLAGYDLSGIGWTSSNFGVTLISPQHFLTAAHVDSGSTVSFLNLAGIVKTYTVDSSYTVLHAPGINSDLKLVRLATPIAPGDQVNYFPTLLLNSGSDYLGLAVASFGAGQRAGINTIDAAGIVDMLPFPSGDGTADNFVFTTDYDSVTGQTQGAVGDSGSPSFVGIGGSLALIGTHSAIVDASPKQTIDVLVPAYYTQINARLALDGYTFGAYVSAIPEPSTWAALAGLPALAVACHRRRKTARN